MKQSKKLQIQQIDDKIQILKNVSETPKRGWIRTMRTAMNMSLRQMASRLNVTPQSVQEMEEREQTRTISLKNLEQAANALNMRLIYGLLPIDGSLEKLIEDQAKIIAKKIVLRTDATMKLENQQVSNDRLEKAILDLVQEIKNEMPKYLWD